MFKRLKHAKNITLRTVFVIETFWSFEFVSLGIVSNFVLRYSDFHPAKRALALAPSKGAQTCRSIDNH